MSPHTETLLRAIAALTTEAQRNPASKALGRLREARGKAEAAWVAAGCPDLSDGIVRPTAPPPLRPVVQEEAKDWSPVSVILEVVGIHDKAIRVSDGHNTWLPCRLVWQPGTRNPFGIIERGDTIEADIPAWLADEKGLR